MVDKVNILGTDYEIQYLTSKDDERLEKVDGYCDFYSKLIVVCNEENGNIHDYKAYFRKVLRHEIVHAFLFESGLAQNSSYFESGWADNEEMVDWIAIQGEKIHKAWEEAGALG